MSSEHAKQIAHECIGWFSPKLTRAEAELEITKIIERELSNHTSTVPDIIAIERELGLDIDELQDELAELRLRIKDQGRIETCLDTAGEILSRMRSRLVPDPPCAECGFPKNCHAENPATAHRFSPANDSLDTHTGEKK